MHQIKLCPRRLPVLVAGMVLLFIARSARGGDSLLAVTDNTSYNVGSLVRMKIIFNRPGASPSESVDVAVSLRYAGELRSSLDEVTVVKSFRPSDSEPATGYFDVWKIPGDAKTGRYQVDAKVRESNSHQIVLSLPDAGSFAVYRKLVRIEAIGLNKTFYTSGDPVTAAVTLKNLTDRPLPELRVEFSDRYWPWIAPSAESSRVHIVPLAEALILAARGEKQIQSSRAAVAETVKRPAVHQYAVVVWDHERKKIYDIAFSAITIIRPPGVDRPEPYSSPAGLPMQYLHRDLGAVKAATYRRFYPPAFDSPAVEFDRTHTMFAPGSDAEIGFSIANRTSTPWRGVSIRSHLLDPSGKEIASSLGREVVLEAGAPPAKTTVKFALPARASGIYRAEVEVRDASGEVLAANSLELGINPLPKSILIFSAHQDDEGAHAGSIRAAIENQVPVHVVYFTGSDAGSCDRYYQHSCDPAEGLNFGVLRMEESRAALGHLGVPRENIHFLGLPDGGLGEIWSNHVDPSNPYLSVFLASDHAPYEGLARPNLPYARKSVVEVAEEFIRKFQPEVIFAGHPDERHVDHRTNSWFVVKALQELDRGGTLSPMPTLLVDQTYGAGPQTPAPYHYEKHVLNLSGETTALAQEAAWFYQSQNGNRSEGNLRTFDKLRRVEIHWRVLDWKEHEGWNEKD